MVYITHTSIIGMNQITQEDQTVSNEILTQLRSAKTHGFPFLLYTGIKKIQSTPNGLLLKVPSNPKKISSVIVTLMISDTYRVQFYQKNKVVETINDVYADILAELITIRMGVY